MQSFSLQDNAIEDLRRSKKAVGELVPIVVDKRTGQVLSGNHRKKVGWHKVEYVTTKDDLEALRMRLHFNVQRGTPPGETVEIFRAYAEELARRSKTNEDIVRLIVEMSPYHPHYTSDMIPDRYKRSGGYRRIQASEFEDKPVVVDGVEISPAPLPSEREKLVEFPCEHCGCPFDWKLAEWPKSSPGR